MQHEAKLNYTAASDTITMHCTNTLHQLVATWKASLSLITHELTRGLLVLLQKEDKFLIKADVPGVQEERVNLSVDGDLLTIAVEGEGGDERDEEREGIRVHRIERVRTWARRVVRLPDSAGVAPALIGSLAADHPRRKSCMRVGCERLLAKSHACHLCYIS